MRLKYATVLIIALGLLSVGCSDGSDVPTTTPTIAPIPTLPPTSIPTPASTPTPQPTATPSPTATPTPGPIQIFERVSGSIPFIETPIGAGSGILIHDGFILTNLHVVWPYDSVRVAFPDGTELLEVPVFSTDSMLDIALLGPVEVDAPSVQLSDGESFPIGTETFLIGYPGDLSLFPQPTFSRGLISRIRQWPAGGLTIIQTDHVVSGGQSGGALVSDNGDVIGVSTLGITRASFSGALSISDLQERIDSMAQGKSSRLLGDRSLDLEQLATTAEFTISDEWDHATFVLTGEPNSTANISVTGDNDAFLFVLDAFGELVTEQVDEFYSGTEETTVRFDQSGLLFVDINQSTPVTGQFTISCNCSVSRISDPDDGVILPLDFEFAANLDFRGDADYFFIDLIEDQTIEISVNSGNFDAFGIASWVGSGESQIYFDDDSGGGVLGWDPLLNFRAPFTGRFIFLVRDNFDSTHGGYFITARELEQGHADSVPAKSAVISTAFGDMVEYELGSAPFTVLYPASWTRMPPIPDLLIEAQFSGSTSQSLVITIEDIFALDLESPTLEDYSQLIVQIMESGEFQVDSKQTITTSSGLEVERIEASRENPALSAVRYVLVFSDEDGTRGVNLTTIDQAPDMSDSQELLDFILDSLAIDQ